ncbi:MAG: flagellar biosynthesis anti-sigma factor FlgM [Planctomycetota bacterium]
MSDIAPVGRPALTPASGTNGAARPTPSEPTVSRGGDRLELSSTARLLAQLSESPTIREDLVQAVRGEIDRGTYETPEKIGVAVDRLFEELA